MDRIKQITVSLKPWQMLALTAVGLFMLSYLLAATMPDYRMKPGGGEEATFMQAFHGIFSVASGVGSIVFGIMTFDTLWNKGRD